MAVAEQESAIQEAASYDAKYLSPGSIVHNPALAIEIAAAFDANFLTPDSIVHNLGPEMTSAHAARWQAMAEYYEQNGMLNVDDGFLAEVSAGR